ncbi:hypothetical protein l11_20630 [Neisseria weaveri LMG 5135]|nr:hypothetical protein l11_20630 [Neisseria weaveri LMG 5135]
MLSAKGIIIPIITCNANIFLDFRRPQGYGLPLFTEQPAGVCRKQTLFSVGLFSVLLMLSVG